MEYLQYLWKQKNNKKDERKVLNLIINGIPSILQIKGVLTYPLQSFKPYYKWNTFNTVSQLTGNGF